MKKIFVRIFDFIKKYKSYILIILIVVVSIFSIFMQNIEKKEQMKINGKSLDKKEDKICVYITGEVKNQGVYYLEENSRLCDLIDICGGLTEMAEISDINLAKKLVDSDKIVIPKIKDTIDNNENNLITNIVEDEIENLDDVDDIDNINSSEKININTASKDMLQNLDGIGEKTAEKIIEYRKNNKFQKIEDIMEVSGIGEAKFEAIKDYICVD